MCVALAVRMGLALVAVRMAVALIMSLAVLLIPARLCTPCRHPADTLLARSQDSEDGATVVVLYAKKRILVEGKFTGGNDAEPSTILKEARLQVQVDFAAISNVGTLCSTDALMLGEGELL